MPSSKLNKVPNHKERAQKPSGKVTKPRDSKDSPCKCYSCNYLVRTLPDCSTHKRYLKESKVKKDTQHKSNKKEYISMANVINFSPVKTSLEEEDPHNSASTTSPKRIYRGVPKVPILSVGEFPPPQLPNLDDNAFDIDDLTFLALTSGRNDK
jgi:hypothetical protein